MFRIFFISLVGAGERGDAVRGAGQEGVAVLSGKSQEGGLRAGVWGGGEVAEGCLRGILGGGGLNIIFSGLKFAPSK